MTTRKPDQWSAEEIAWLMSPEGRAAQDELRGDGNPKPAAPRVTEPPRTAQNPRKRVIVAKPDPVAQKRLLALCQTGVQFKDIAALVGVHPAKLALLRDGVTSVDVDLSGITIERVNGRMTPVRRKTTTQNGRGVDDARRHVQLLIDAGFRVREISRAAGVSDDSLSAFVSGQRTIRQSTADRILATSPAAVQEHCLEVPATVPSRMLRTLTAVGWAPSDIVAATGMSPRTVYNVRDSQRRRVSRETAELIERAYYDLMSRPAPTGRKARMMLALARRNRWAVPGVDAA